MDSIFMIKDTTDDECWYVLSVTADLSEAKKMVVAEGAYKQSLVQEYSDDYLQHVEFTIEEWSLGRWLESGKVRHKVTWNWRWTEDEEDVEWYIVQQGGE